MRGVRAASRSVSTALRAPHGLVHQIGPAAGIAHIKILHVFFSSGSHAACRDSHGITPANPRPLPEQPRRSDGALPAARPCRTPGSAPRPAPGPSPAAAASVPFSDSPDRAPCAPRPDSRLRSTRRLERRLVSDKRAKLSLSMPCPPMRHFADPPRGLRRLFPTGRSGCNAFSCNPGPDGPPARLGFAHDCETLAHEPDSASDRPSIFRSTMQKPFQ